MQDSRTVILSRALRASAVHVFIRTTKLIRRDGDFNDSAESADHVVVPLRRSGAPANPETTLTWRAKRSLNPGSRRLNDSRARFAGCPPRDIDCFGMPNSRLAIRRRSGIDDQRSSSCLHLLARWPRAVHGRHWRRLCGRGALPVLKCVPAAHPFLIAMALAINVAAVVDWRCRRNRLAVEVRMVHYRRGCN